jgi:hypothetical protein
MSDTKQPEQKPSRRKFLAAAVTGSVGAAAAGFPMIAKAQAGPITMRWQSTWPAKDIFHEYAQDFAKKVNDMSGGASRSRCCRPAPWSRPSACSTPCPRARSTAATACSPTGTARIPRWRCGVPARPSAWTPTWCWPGTSTAAARSCSTKSTRPQPRRAVLPLRADADAAAGLVQEADHQARGHQGPEVPHRRPGDRHVQGHGRGGECAARRRDRAGAWTAACSTPPSSTTPSSDRLLGFPDVSKHCMLQSFHQCSEHFEILFNKKKLRRAAGRDEGDHRQCRRGRLGRHVVEGDRPLFEGLHRDAGEAGRQVLQDAGRHPAAQLEAWDKIVAAKKRRKPAVQEGARIAARLRQRACRWQNDTSVDYAWPTTTSSPPRRRPPRRPEDVRGAVGGRPAFAGRLIFFEQGKGAHAESFC